MGRLMHGPTIRQGLAVCALTIGLLALTDMTMPTWWRGIGAAIVSAFLVLSRGAVANEH